MIFKLLILCVVYITTELVSARSLTIILDTTTSMRDEIQVIRQNMPSFAGVLRNATNFENYILVPFHDPGVGTPIISSSPEEMISALNSLTVSGGEECPEDSLAGIKLGLEISKPKSFVYVFTDADAIDTRRFQEIENLCRRTKSQVVIFLTGSCPASDTINSGDIHIYYDIATTCSGAVFKFDYFNLRQAFNYIEKVISSDWTDVVTHELITGNKEVQVTLDFYTIDFLIALSGDAASMLIVDAEGRPPQTETVVSTDQTTVVRVINFNPGVFKIYVTCDGLENRAVSLTFYKKIQIPFEYGFSKRLPHDLRETTSRPLPGCVNYILIVPSKEVNIHITSVELHMTDSGEKKMVDFVKSDPELGYYVYSAYIEPDRSFKCVVYGEDATVQDITGTTDVIEVQKLDEKSYNLKPTVELIGFDGDLINFGTETTVGCKVKGYPKPDIQWEDNSEPIYTTEEVLLEIPTTYISYVTVNATTNTTLSCKATNTGGVKETSMDLFVNRTHTFQVIESPQDSKFDYGRKGKLYCEVDAYPEAQIRWYLNDTEVHYIDNIEVQPEENALVIKEMSLIHIGTYKCVAENSDESVTNAAIVTISGLEAPKVNVENKVVNLKPGDKKQIECSLIKGTPKPTITWEYKNTKDYSFSSYMPSGVVVEEYRLNIPGKLENKGTYRCRASNLIGDSYVDVSVNMQYAPRILNSNGDTVTVIESNIVELTCEVEGSPTATVRWEMTRGAESVQLDSRHTTDDRNTHRFVAMSRDSGDYHCIAENEVGISRKTTTVNVLVPPYIEPPDVTEIELAAGTNATLKCKVLHGNPPPATKWEFVATDGTRKTFPQCTCLSPSLHLENVSAISEGMYQCVADNEVGNDSIEYTVKVK